jgi:hypothetical protein
MSVTIEHMEYGNGKELFVRHPEGCFTVSVNEYNRHHEGVWNSRVLAFVPQPNAYFSDGTPVASYEGWLQ